MSKLRLSIKHYSIDNKLYQLIILLNQIEHVIIDNITYYKCNYTKSYEIQNIFYKNIIINLSEISEIKCNHIDDKNGFIIYKLKNLYLHCETGIAVAVTGSNILISQPQPYYLNGKHITKEEFNKYLRYKKLIKLTNNLDIS
jgi:hypothetical protein